ncbi:MAG: superoxide dismutase [Planctomycetota bacterium]
MTQRTVPTDRPSDRQMSSDRQAIDRRAALGVIGGAAIAGLASTAGGSMTSAVGRAGLTPEQLGWDPKKAEYVLPPLPYDYAALEPAIDAETMRIHHGRHHAGYVRGMNEALEQMHAIRWEKSDPGTLEHWQRELSFNAGGHVNHTLFWLGMRAPREGNRPGGALAEAIQEDFGSVDKFMWHFTEASAGVEGSGWGWLVYEPIAGRLMISQMHNQQQMLFAGAVPLLGVDVWEHAYYLKYQNRRKAYLEAWWSVVDWDAIGGRFAAATGA